MALIPSKEGRAEVLAACEGLGPILASGCDASEQVSGERVSGGTSFGLALGEFLLAVARQAGGNSSSAVLKKLPAGLLTLHGVRKQLVRAAVPWEQHMEQAPMALASSMMVVSAVMITAERVTELLQLRHGTKQHSALMDAAYRAGEGDIYHYSWQRPSLMHDLGVCVYCGEPVYVVAVYAGVGIDAESLHILWCWFDRAGLHGAAGVARAWQQYCKTLRCAAYVCCYAASGGVAASAAGMRELLPHSQ